MVLAGNTSGTVTFTVIPGGSVAGYVNTVAGDPSSSGTNTGTFTISLAISAPNAAFTITPVMWVANASGAVQFPTVTGAAQNGGNSLLTWTFVNPSLGTWASGDRFVVQFTFLNTNGA